MHFHYAKSDPTTYILTLTININHLFSSAIAPLTMIMKRGARVNDETEKQKQFCHVQLCNV
jgi:hypothetical protein